MLKSGQGAWQAVPAKPWGGGGGDSDVPVNLRPKGKLQSLKSSFANPVATHSSCLLGLSFTSGYPKHPALLGRLN